MKKFLSLVLALIMTMSLVTIGAGAKDFTDDGKINYEEAVDVMSEIGVIDGYTDGSFNPQGGLTRGAAAKIICNMILGPTTAAALSADTAPFSDVSVDNTFAGYIAYCVKENLVSGYADGTFRPAAPLTGYAFMKMLLTALGYDQVTEGYTGANWSVNVAKQALAIGLNKGLDGEFVGTKALNREEACLYAFNALKATLVEYDAKTVVSVGGAEVAISGNIKEVSWGTAKANDGKIKADGYVQFAEKHFPKLEVETVKGTYGRPANKWTFKNDTIGTYTSIEPDFVYTAATKEKDVYADLGKAKVEADSWTVYVDGHETANASGLSKTETDKWEYTKDGAVTEIYVEESKTANDTDILKVTCVVINNYIGQVTRVKTDSDGEYVTVKALYSGKDATKLDNNKFYVEGYDVDDYVVFTMDEDDDGDAIVASVAEPEIVTGVVDRVQKTEDAYNTYLRIEGDKYTYSKWIVYDLDDVNEAIHPDLKEEYDLLLDENGYVLAYRVAGEKAPAQYLWVIDSWKTYGEWTAKVLLPDGTTVRVDLNDEYVALELDGEDEPTELVTNDEAPIEWIKDTDDDGQDGNAYDSEGTSNIDGQVWAFTVDKDGVYTLEEVIHEDDQERAPFADVVWNSNTVEIENDEAYVQFTDNTDYFIVDEDTLFVDKEDATTYTGYSEVPNVEEAPVAYVLDGSLAEVVFILDGDKYDTDSTYLIRDGSEEIETTKYDGSYYRIYFDAYVNGEPAKEVLVKKGQTFEPGTLYKVKKTVDEDYITVIEEVEVPEEDQGLVETVANKAFYLNGTDVKTDKWTVSNDTTFVVVECQYDEEDVEKEIEGEEGETETVTQYTFNGEYDIYAGSLSDMKVSDADAEEGWLAYAYVVEHDGQKAEVVYIYRFMDGENVIYPEA